jgi:hypothetical protein
MFAQTTSGEAQSFNGPKGNLHESNFAPDEAILLLFRGSQSLAHSIINKKELLLARLLNSAPSHCGRGEHPHTHARIITQLKLTHAAEPAHQFSSSVSFS